MHNNQFFITKPKTEPLSIMICIAMFSAGRTMGTQKLLDNDLFFLDYQSHSAVLHGPSVFAVKAKIYRVIYSQSSSIAFDETSCYWSAPKAPNFSALHWSPHGCLVSVGQHFVTTRVVHLPKRTKTSLITESDQSGPDHRIGTGCVGRA